MCEKADPHCKTTFKTTNNLKLRICRKKYNTDIIGLLTLLLVLTCKYMAVRILTCSFKFNYIYILNFFVL